MTANRVVVLVVALVVAVLAAVGTALAQEERLEGKVRFGDGVVVDEDETVPGNLYVFGGNVSILGPVEGDLVIAAGQVDVSGDVGGDVLVASGTATVSGAVAGDVRASTGQTSIRGPVAGDVAASAGQVTVASGASIGQDLIFAAGQVDMAGAVEGDVLGVAGGYSASGTVAGSEQVRVDQPPDAGERVLDGVSRFVSILAVGALVLWLAPRRYDGAIDTATSRLLPSLGWGAVAVVAVIAFYIVTFIVAILLTVVLGLAQLGPLVAAIWLATVTSWIAIGFGVYVMAAFGAPIVAGGAAGSAMLSDGAEGWGPRFGRLVLGLVVIVVLTSLGVIGSLIGLVLFILAVGAVTVSARTRGGPTPDRSPEAA